MKKVMFVLIFAMALIKVSAQKTIINDANAQARTVGSFHAIEVSNSIDLYLSQGNEEAVAVSANDSKYRDRIKTEVSNGVLKIYMEKENGFSWTSGNHKLKAYVSCKMLDKLSASGSSDVYVDGSLTGDNLAIQLTGSSDFKGTVKVNELSLDQRGSSDATISGQANNVTINISGSSDVRGYGLVVDNCTAQASGSSDLNITVNKELNAHASGSSDIYYKGAAVIKDLHSSGSSTVSKKD